MFYRKPNKMVLIAFGTMVCIIVAIFSYTYIEGKLLLRNGVQEEFVVIEKHKKGYNMKFAIETYYITVDKFKITGTKPYHKTKDTTNLTNAEKFSERILSQIFKDKYKRTIEPLNQPVTIKYIKGKSYNDLAIGSIVTLVYYKDNPENGRLLREIN